MAKDSMGLDDVGDGVPSEVDSRPAKDADGIPYCKKHHCRMKAYSGGGKSNPKSYYKCTVEGCGETDQKIKTTRDSVVPHNPLACPRCSGRSAKEPVYCERDEQASTSAMVILKCPRCGWKSGAMVVPHLAAAHFARAGRSSPPRS